MPGGTIPVRLSPLSAGDMPGGNSIGASTLSDCFSLSTSDSFDGSVSIFFNSSILSSASGACLTSSSLIGAEAFSSFAFSSLFSICSPSAATSFTGYSPSTFSSSISGASSFCLVPLVISFSTTMSGIITSANFLIEIMPYLSGSSCSLHIVVNWSISSSFRGSASVFMKETRSAVFI